MSLMPSLSANPLIQCHVRVDRTVVIAFGRHVVPTSLQRSQAVLGHDSPHILRTQPQAAVPMLDRHTLVSAGMAGRCDVPDLVESRSKLTRPGSGGNACLAARQRGVGYGVSGDDPKDTTCVARSRENHSIDREIGGRVAQQDSRGVAVRRVVVAGSALKILDPDADEAAASIMASAQGLMRLSVQVGFSHRAILRSAVTSVSSGHGSFLQESPGGELEPPNCPAAGTHSRPKYPFFVNSNRVLQEGSSV